MTSLIIKHFKTIHTILFAISIGGIILCFNDSLRLGAILILLSSGLDNMLRFSCKSEPNLIAGNIKGFDYLLKMIFKDNFNQVYNLYTGIIFLLIGLILLVAPLL